MSGNSGHRLPYWRVCCVRCMHNFVRIGIANEMASPSQGTSSENPATAASSACSQKKFSKIWDFFSIENPADQKAKCLVCSAKISRGGTKAKSYTTSNLRNHIKACHTKEFKLLEIKETEQESVQKKRKLTGSDSTTSELKKVHQMKLQECINKATPWSSKDSRTLAINRKIAEMIAMDFEPFSIVERVGFQRLVATLEPRYKLPSRHHLSETIIPDMYRKIVESVKEELEGMVFLSLTTDIWSSSCANHSLMSLTGQWIDSNFERKRCVLSASSFPGSHTGKAISEEIARMLAKWDIPKERVLVLLSDTAANAVSGCQLTGITHLGCFIHKLQLVINDAIGSQRSVNDMLANCRKIAGHFNRSPLANFDLKAIQIKHGLPEHRIIQDVATRWNSSYYMLERILEQRLALVEFSSEHDIPMMTSNQWTIGQTLLRTLRRFEQITREMSAAQATCSSIIPSVSLLGSVLSHHEDDKGIQTLTGELAESLKRRFSDIEANKLLVLTTFVDPRYKDVFFNFKPDEDAEDRSASSVQAHDESTDVLKLTRNKLSTWLNEESTADDHAEKAPAQIAAQSTSSAELSESSAKSIAESKAFGKQILDKDYERLLSSKGAVTSQSQSKTLNEEVKLYVSEPLIGRDEDPLSYWRINGIRFRKLSKIARKYLCAPPSSVDSERLFSEAGDIYEEKRNRLNPEKCEMLLVIRGNMPLLGFNY